MIDLLKQLESDLRASGFDFDGPTFVHSKDGQRLAGQLKRVFLLMQDGRERTLKEIALATGDTESSVSARLRDLRKPKFGGYQVDRERVKGGLYCYRLMVKNRSAG